MELCHPRVPNRREISYFVTIPYGYTVIVGQDGIDVKHGAFKLQNIVSEGTTAPVDISDFGTLTIVGETLEQTMPGSIVGQEAKYNVLTIGQHTFADNSGAQPNPTEMTYQGTMSVGEGTLVLGDYEAQGQAAFEAFHAEDINNYLADHENATAEEAETAVSTSVLYIGQETKVVGTVALNGDHKHTYIDLAGVAKNGYATDRVIFDAENATNLGNGNTITFANLNKDVVVKGENGALDSINVGDVFENAHYEFGTSLYRDGDVDGGLATIEVDADEYADIKEMQLHSQAAVDDALFN